MVVVVVVVVVVVDGGWGVLIALLDEMSLGAFFLLPCYE